MAVPVLRCCRAIQLGVHPTAVRVMARLLQTAWLQNGTARTVCMQGEVQVHMTVAGEQHVVKHGPACDPNVGYGIVICLVVT